MSATPRVEIVPVPGGYSIRLDGLQVGFERNPVTADELAETYRTKPAIAGAVLGIARRSGAGVSL